MKKRMERKEGERQRGRVRKVVRRTTTLINFPRQCLQWFLKIDQSECSKSSINLHQSNNSCVVPHSEHHQS